MAEAPERRPGAHARLPRWLPALLVATCVACTADDAAPGADTQDGLADAPGTDTAGDAPAPDTPAEDTVRPPPLAFTAVTFNTGSAPEQCKDGPAEGHFGCAEAALTDTWYGNGLAWAPFVAATADWFAGVDPDIVAFQEIFWSGDCPAIPSEARTGFVCETWSPGDPTVAQTVLGDAFQIACHPGKPDKCAAVHRRFGSFRGCDDDLCLDGLEGYPVDGCGSGARVARGTIDLTTGGTLTLVSFHGSSGGSDDDIACRLAQVHQVFDDLGDGAPGAKGARNLILGDLNTDPGRLAELPDAAEWLSQTGDQGPFRWHSDIGPDVTPTYAGFVNIDHALSDAFVGGCWSAGITDGHPAVLDAVFFDHVPLVCPLTDL